MWRIVLTICMGLCLVACGGDVDCSMAGTATPKLRLEAPTALRILVIGGRPLLLYE